MIVLPTDIPGLLILDPKVHSDERGFFFESFNHQAFCDLIGEDVDFVQDNHSRSYRNVLRGLHYQTGLHAQGKLVRCVRGEVFDVAVDLRQDSPTRGKWYGLRVSDANKLQLWIPPGFAHGFLVLSDVADFVYKTTNYWNPMSERSLRWNCPHLGIVWPLEGEPLLSGKDAVAPLFA